MMGTVAGVAQEPADCGHPVPDRSIRACSVIIERGGAAADKLAGFYLLRGIAYFMREETDRALADFEAAIGLSPDQAAPLAARGHIYFQRGEYERSLADYDEAFRRNPNDAAVYVARHEALTKLGRPTAPPAGLEQPPHLEFHYGQALRGQYDFIVRRTAQFRAQVEKEFAELDRAIALNPGDGAAYVKRASAFLRFGETLVAADRILWEEDQAVPNFAGLQAARVLADFDQAIRVSPTFAEAFLARGAFFFRKGDYDRAIADLSEALRLRPRRRGLHQPRQSLHQEERLWPSACRLRRGCPPHSKGAETLSSARSCTRQIGRPVEGDRRLPQGDRDRPRYRSGLFGGER
jgi:tetratricopeptide (TPR) repeat protein